MTSGVLLGIALTIFLVTMGWRLPWTRPVGWLLVGATALFAVLSGLRHPEGPNRWIEPQLLPVILFTFLAAASFWLSMYWEQEPSGGSSAEAASAKDPARGLRARALGVCFGIVVIFLLAWRVPPELPIEAENPWFLAGLEEIGFWTGPWAAWILLPALALTCLLAAPFLDTKEPEVSARFHGRSDEVPFFFFAWWFLGVLPIVLGGWLRPAGRLLAEAEPVPWAEVLWHRWLETPIPEFWLLRELPGILVLIVLLVVLPWRLPTWKPTRGAFSRHRRRLGRVYWPAMFLMAAVVWVFFAYFVGSLAGIGPWHGGSTVGGS